MVAGPTAPFLAHFLHAWDNLTWGFLWGYSIWSAYISSSAHANEVLAFLLRIFKFEVLAFLPVLMQMNSSNWQCTQIFYKVLYFKVCQWHFCVHSYICVDHWLGKGHSQRFEAKPAKKNPHTWRAWQENLLMGQRRIGLSMGQCPIQTLTQPFCFS
jgi:hypothetical protein